MSNNSLWCLFFWFLYCVTLVCSKGGRGGRSRSRSSGSRSGGSGGSCDSECGMIIGIVFGGVFCIICCLGTIIWVKWKRNKNKKATVNSNDEDNQLSIEEWLKKNDKNDKNDMNKTQNKQKYVSVEDKENENDIELEVMTTATTNSDFHATVFQDGYYDGYYIDCQKKYLMNDIYLKFNNFDDHNCDLYNYELNEVNLKLYNFQTMIEGNGSDNIGDYNIYGKYNNATHRMVLLKKYVIGTGDYAENKGHTIEIRLKWTKNYKQFQGYWLMDNKYSKGTGECCIQKKEDI